MLPQRGGVYWFPDDKLTLPPNSQRNLHPRRPVIVVSSDVTNHDRGWPTVLIVPASSSTSLHTEFCLKLNKGDGGLDKKTWARVPAVQPVLKADLEDFVGRLSPDLLEQLYARLVRFMGLI